MPRLLGDVAGFALSEMLKCCRATFLLCQELNTMVDKELRKDYLLKRWAVTAPERSRRPTDFAKQTAESAQNGVCPLCAGNEHMTPPAIMLYLKQNGEIRKDKDQDGTRAKNWLVRVIPNLFPPFGPYKHATYREETKSPRLVLDNAHFVVFTPYASVHPLEFWILPKKHAANPLCLSKVEKEA